MSKKKAIIYTSLFTVAVIGAATVMMYIKPYGGEVSLFHAFSPFFVGIWLADIIDKFYKYLCKKIK